MTFKSVCFLFEVPPLKSYYERYDMHLLKEAGFDILVYDCSPMLHPMMQGPTAGNDMEGVETVTVRRIASVKELQKYRDEWQDAFVWSTIPLFDKSVFLLREISRNHYGFICNIDYVPHISRKVRAENKDFWLKWSPSRIRNAILARIPHPWLPIKKADIMITYSQDRVKENLQRVLWNKNTEVILSNTLDYNECLKKTRNNTDRLIEKPYVLFVDQYIPYHADGKELGYNIDPERYYSEINRFLDYISTIRNQEIVIAAHPKARYDEHDNCYPGKRIIQFQTCELVRDAELVVSHFSISLSFVNAFLKPLLLVSTDEMEESEIIYAGLKSAADEMERDLINVSKIHDRDQVEELLEEEMRKPKEYYEKQARRYRLGEEHPNSNRLFGEVLLEAMKGI